MTIVNGNSAFAADVLAIAATANSALTAAGAASANAATALANAISATAIAGQALTASGLALSVPALPAGGAIGNNDLIPIGHNGSTVAISVNTFNAGLAGSIAAVGTTASAALTTATAAGVSAATAIVNAASATAIANAASVAASHAFTIGGLTVVTNVGTADLVPIGQAGSTVAVTTANLLAAETIDQLVASGAASDTDTFLTGQGTNVMTRQTMSAIWDWLKTHLPGYQVPVREIVRNTTIDGTYNGNILVVTVAGVVLTPNYTLMGAGFACEIVTSGSGTVTWGSGVTATNGASGLPIGSYAKLLAVTSSAGNVVLASVGSPAAGGATPPGTISGLTLAATTATTLAFTWTAPSTGGTATYYAAQYRVTSAGGSWTAAPNTSVASAALTGLASSTQYDVQVAAGNAGGLSAWSATVAGTTAAPSLAAPGAPSGLTVGTVTSTTVPLTWTAPGTGGAVASYTVQYRVTSVGGAWTPVTGIAAAATTMTGLTAATQYDFQVAAVNAGGTSAYTATAAGTTAAAPSTTAAWGTYPTSIVHGTSGIVFNLQITSGTTPTIVDIGFSTSQTVAPSPMPATVDGTAGNFNGTYWGTYMHAPASAGTVYAWAVGRNTAGVLFAIAGPPVTVT